MLSITYFNRSFVLICVALPLLTALGCEVDHGSATFTNSATVENSAPAVPDKLPFGGEKLLPVGSIEIISTRLAAYENSEGQKFKTVLVKWKNSGQSPIRAVDADIYLADQKGRKLAVVEDKPIYAVSDDSPGVAPGEVYEDPIDNGYLIDPRLTDTIGRARVKVKKVVANGAF
jgi:hypothetical protein